MPSVRRECLEGGGGVGGLGGWVRWGWGRWVRGWGGVGGSSLGRVRRREGEDGFAREGGMMGELIDPLNYP